MAQPARHEPLDMYRSLVPICETRLRREQLDKNNSGLQASAIVRLDTDARLFAAESFVVSLRKLHNVSSQEFYPH